MSNEQDKKMISKVNAPINKKKVRPGENTSQISPSTINDVNGVLPPWHEMQVVEVSIDDLRFSDCNPRTWSKEAISQLKESIRLHGLLVPLLVNSAPGRKGMVLGGNFRLKILKELGYTKVQVIYISVPEILQEKKITIRLNKAVGDWCWEALAKLDEAFLMDLGFTSMDFDNNIGFDETPEKWDLEKELAKLNIDKITIQTGDMFMLGRHRLLTGNSMEEADVLKLMGEDRADLCLTDPPYILDYLRGKKKKQGQPTEGFGYKRDRHYLGTDSLPDDFTMRWMANVHKVQAENFAVIVYENWKNIKHIWTEMEKYWKIKNLLVYHIPNRVQGFAAKYKFFNKSDIAMVGTSGDVTLNMEEESELLQNCYETALFAISGKPHWESYAKGKKYCPTDFIQHKSDDAKSSDNPIIFGTKPVNILIPYIKTLTLRDAIVLEPFGGSGSTLIACEKMSRQCRMMEKSPVYVTLIIRRWERLTGKKAVQL